MVDAHATDAPDADRLAALAKALGHPARVRILELLGPSARCHVGDLTAELGLAQSTVSEHIRILREAGVVDTGTLDGRPCYCIDRTSLAELGAGVGALLGAD